MHCLPGKAKAGGTAKYLIGSGKVEELRDLVHAEEADLVIFNHTLTPG